MKKTIISLCIIIITLLVGQANTYATQTPQLTDTSSISNYKFEKVASAPTISMTPSIESGMSSIISKIFGVAAYICYAAAIIIIIVKGVQFANSAPEGKAEIKKQMIAICIGVALIFAIDRILRIISNITRSSIS